MHESVKSQLIFGKAFSHITFFLSLSLPLYFHQIARWNGTSGIAYRIFHNNWTVYASHTDRYILAAFTCVYFSCRTCLPFLQIVSFIFFLFVSLSSAVVVHKVKSHLRKYAWNGDWRMFGWLSFSRPFGSMRWVSVECAFWCPPRTWTLLKFFCTL